MPFPLLPLMAGAGLLALLAAGGKKKTLPGSTPGTSPGAILQDGGKTPQEIAQAEAERKEAAADAKQAVAQKDWQKAVADALASQDPATIKAVAAELKKAGKTQEAEMLLEALDDIVAEAEAARLKREQEAAELAAKKPVQGPIAVETMPEPDGPVVPKNPDKLAESVAQEKPKAVEIEEAETALDDENSDEVFPDEVEAEAEEQDEEIIPEPSPKMQQAEDMADMLESSSRYNEDRPLVKAYQVANGLTGDGLYGRGTARSLWEIYRIIPPNPYYWPKSGTSAALADYDKFLLKVLEARPDAAEEIAALRRTLGR